MAPKIPPKKTFKEQAKVLFQYTAENEDELTIKEGDIINIISKQIEDKGWMRGELNGKIGVFPDNFVEIISNRLQLTNSSQTTNNFQKSTTTNFLNNNGSTNDNSPPKLPTKTKPIPETKLSKVITSKFNEIISKSNTESPKSSLFNLTKQQSEDQLNNKNTNQAPSLPLKKSKLFTTTPPKPFHHRESSEENLDKQDDLNSLIDEQTILSPTAKLTHLTANRNKGPSRRPPSIIQIPKDDESSLTSSNSLNNLSDLNVSDTNKNNLDLENKELNNKTNNKTEMSTNKTPPTTQPPWMLELKKTQAEKKNVDVGKIKKNFSLGDENTLVTTNGNSPNSSKNLIQQSPNSPTKLTTTPIAATPFNHRMSGDYSSRFKEFLQQQPQNSPNINSLSRHSSVNNHNFNSSRTLSTDSLDCKEQSSLGFGNLTSPFTSVKPIKAAKPTTVNNKFISGSPTATTNNFLSNSNLNNNSNNNSNNQLANNQTNKDLVSRKEFDELQKRVNDLTDIVENQKQIYKGLVTDLINDIAEEKKKVANLSIEVDRLRKLTTTV